MFIKAHDYKLVFGTDVQVGLDKASRLIYGDSVMTHAMVSSCYYFCRRCLDFTKLLESVKTHALVR